MARRRFRPEAIIGKLREADVLLSQGMAATEVVKALGLSEVTYWVPQDGGFTPGGTGEQNPGASP